MDIFFDKLLRRSENTRRAVIDPRILSHCTVLLPERKYRVETILSYRNNIIFDILLPSMF